MASSYAFFEYSREDALEKGYVIRPPWAGGRCVSAPLLKNQMYYSTKGNSWTNKYLTPINRRKDQFGYRPDLDEFAKTMYEKKVEEEEERKEMEMDRLKSFRQAQLDLMKERREGHDAIDYSRGGGGGPPLTRDERHRKKYIVKDNLYYHGRWNKWTNLSHIPENRIPLLCRPYIIEKDEEAARTIDRKRQEEVEYEYARQDYLGYLAEEDKAHLDHQRAVRQSFEDSLYGPNRCKTHQPKASERTEALAQPKNKIYDANGPETADYTGLITTSTAAPQIYQSLHRPYKETNTKYSLDDWVERSKRSSSTSSSSNKKKMTLSEHSSDIPYSLPDNEEYSDDDIPPFNELLNDNNYTQQQQQQDDNNYNDEENIRYISPDTEVIPTKVGTMFVNRSEYPEPKSVISPDLADNVYHSVSETSLERNDRIEGMNHIDNLYKHSAPPIDKGDEVKNRNPKPIQEYTSPRDSPKLNNTNNNNKIRKPSFINNYWEYVDQEGKKKEEKKKKEEHLLPILQKSYPQGQLI